MNIRNLMLLVWACALSACGGGGGDGGISDIPGPHLVGFSIYQKSAYTGMHPGVLELSGSVIISEVLAKRIQINFVNASGGIVARASGEFYDGMGTGLFSFATSIDISTLPAGTYEVEMRATSSTGGVSNRVTQTFQMVSYPWKALSPMPQSVSEFALASVGTKVYVMGGLSTVNGVATPSADVQVYDTATAQWSTGAKAPRARAGATAAAVGTRIYLMGGYDSANPTGFASVDVLDTQTGQWSSGPAAPTARFYACAAAIGSQIYLVDGTQSMSIAPATAALERLDTASGTWSTLASSGYAVAHPACTAANGALYVSGGEARYTSFGEQQTTSQKYDPASNLWSSTNFFTSRRSRHASVAVQGSVFLIGGHTDAGVVGGLTDVTEVFKTSTGIWSIKAPMPAAAQDVGAALVGGYVYVFSPTASYLYDAVAELP
jgi:N-acetylneuraminic acid mutarotase